MSSTSLNSVFKTNSTPSTPTIPATSYSIRCSVISYIGSNMCEMFSMIFQGFNCCRRKKTLAVSLSSAQTSSKTEVFAQRRIVAFSFTASAYSSTSSISSSSSVSLNQTSARSMPSAVIVNDEKKTTAPAEEDPDKTPIAEDDEY